MYHSARQRSDLSPVALRLDLGGRVQPWMSAAGQLKSHPITVWHLFLAFVAPPRFGGQKETNNMSTCT